MFPAARNSQARIAQTRRLLDPLVAEPPGHEGGDAEGERDRHPDEPQIEGRRVNRHDRMLQERIQPPAVGRDDRGAFEGARDESDQREEESLDHHQRRHRRRDQRVGILAVADQDGDRVDGEQPDPEEQTPRLPPPERADLVEERHFPVAVRPDVVQLEVAHDDRVHEPNYRQGRESGRDEHGIASRRPDIGALLPGGDRAENARYRRGGKGGVDAVETKLNHLSTPTPQSVRTAIAHAGSVPAVIGASCEIGRKNLTP